MNVWHHDRLRSNIQQYRNLQKKQEEEKAALEKQVRSQRKKMYVHIYIWVRMRIDHNAGYSTTW